MKRLRILLVSPTWEGFGRRKKIKIRETQAHPMTLGIIAALSDGHEVAIVNENHEPVPFSGSFDLVGITANTFTLPRAAEIAARFRARKIPVVIGGIAATLEPDRCLEAADAVVVGEAEPVWANVLADACGGRLGGRYGPGGLADLAEVPWPRRDLYRHRRDGAAYLQVTRGCGLSCRFCYLQDVGWNVHRKRPVADVVEEIRSIPQRIILFVDDNPFQDRDYAMELLRAMRGLGKYWWTQAVTTVGLDHELLEAARRAGCYALCLGFQTVEQRSLESMSILQNRIDRYREIVRNAHAHGILVDGTFMFGFDQDGPGIFEDTARMIIDMNLDAYTLYMLTPYPGTTLYDEYRRDGRVVDDDRSRFNWDHPVIKPRRMSPGELEAGLARAYAILDRHARRTLWRRLPSHLRYLRRPALARWLVQWVRPLEYERPGRCKQACGEARSDPEPERRRQRGRENRGIGT